METKQQSFIFTPFSHNRKYSNEFLTTHKFVRARKRMYNKILKEQSYNCLNDSWVLVRQRRVNRLIWPGEQAGVDLERRRKNMTNSNSSDTLSKLMITRHKYHQVKLRCGSCETRAASNVHAFGRWESKYVAWAVRARVHSLSCPRAIV